MIRSKSSFIENDSVNTWVKIGSLATVLLALAAACREEKATPLRAGPGVDAWFPLKVDEVAVQVQVAVTPEERAKGLMFRERLPEGRGMLFTFEEPGPQRFWMKNTRIPLDIGYFTPDGVLREVHAAQPHDLSGCPSNSDRIQFVLELNQGGFRAAGLSPGAKLDLGQVSSALTTRGFRPEDFSLPPVVHEQAEPPESDAPR